MMERLNRMVTDPPDVVEVMYVGGLYEVRRDKDFCGYNCVCGFLLADSDLLKMQNWRWKRGFLREDHEKFHRDNIWKARSRDD